MVHAYSKSIDGNPQFLANLFSHANLFTLFFLVIRQHQVELGLSKFLLQALLEAGAFLFSFRFVGERRRLRRGLRFQVFEIDLFGDTVKIQRWVAFVILEEPVDLCGHYVDGIVCKILRIITTTTARKYSDKTETDFLVLGASDVAIGIKPA